MRPGWRNRRRLAAANAFVEWAREAAVFVGDFADDGFEVERLAFLDEALEGKRIVYLGEPSHWIHEKYPYRLLMVRYLFSRGWRHLGEELSWSDGKRVDRYLETGDPAQLDRVTAYGYEGANRPDRAFSTRSSTSALPKRAPPMTSLIPYPAILFFVWFGPSALPARHPHAIPGR